MGMFQATRSDREDTRKLVHTVNRAVSVDPVKEEHLDKAFAAMWPELEQCIARLPEPERAVKAKRGSEDMIAEILELSRAAAASRKSVAHFDRYIPIFEEFMPLLQRGLREAKLGTTAASVTPPTIYEASGPQEEVRRGSIKLKETRKLEGQGQLVSCDDPTDEFRVRFSFTVVTRAPTPGSTDVTIDMPPVFFGNVLSLDGRSIPDGRYELRTEIGDIFDVTKGGPTGWSIRSRTSQ